MKKSLVLAFIVGLVGGQNVTAELKVGDDAPAIHIKEWVKGEAFDLKKMKDTEVAVVEFWATWCGPCIKSIPHMSEMQQHFASKGVSVIGVTDEDRKVVDRFLKGGGDEKMRYRVAIDDDNKTSDAWMKASNQRGIPTAFVVQGGKLKWIGHPMDGLDLEIAKLVGDTEYAKKAEEAQKRREKVAEIMGRFQSAAMGEDWPKAVMVLDEALALEPDEFSFLMAKYHMLATKLKKFEEAAKVGREIVAKSEEANELNALSWTILTDADFEDSRDLLLAKAGAAKAVQLSKEQDPMIIDTYARSLADTGDLEGAVNWQKKAVELAEKPSEKRDLEKSLKDFEERLEKQKA